jgi:hypothetical protein
MRKQATLKELCYEYSEDESDCEPDKQPAADCLVKIFDVYAIEFAEWRVNDWIHDERWTKISDMKELLEIYKKEKGL